MHLANLIFWLAYLNVVLLYIAPVRYRRGTHSRLMLYRLFVNFATVFISGLNRYTIIHT
ncbi:hypothetical protein BDW02DRAFT_313212 [Decorospora gaudefroyi]|uniref:Uncharacterized protein n=1 Tax=Decorospora gaudefroyi TaxID=184978 RepID=A0A6A5JW99_9PLEO|nr:hypothetical protein BDW02DRAFT_313212 [Decorospora gaudefroyi]